MNKSLPFFSIITVVLNAKDSIEQTIDRVLSQTYTNFEYIIVDGGSTDGTLEVIQKFGDRVRYISEKDRGISDAFNKGVAMAQGDIIGLINGDDWYEADALEIIKSNFIDEQTILCGNVRLTYADGKGKIQKSSLVNIEKSMKVWHPGVFIPKAVYKKVGGYSIDYKVVMDYDFVLRCLANDVNFFMIDRVVSNMRYGGVSNKLIGKAVKESLEIKDKYYPDRRFRNRIEWIYYTIFYNLIIMYKDIRFK